MCWGNVTRIDMVKIVPGNVPDWPRDALLFAGGQGSRLKHLETRVPKCLVSVCPGVTILDLVVAQLAELHVKRLWIAGGKWTEAICTHVNRQWHLPNVRPIYESTEGTCNAIRENLFRLPPKILVVNADTVYLNTPRFPVSGVRQSSALIGTGFSWDSGVGNLLVSGEYASKYDKGGTRSNVSDAGYHILRLPQVETLILKHRGMLEDGFLQELLSEPQPIWHHPLVYLDLGTERTLTTARDALEYYADIRMPKVSVAARSFSALQVLRTSLGKPNLGGEPAVARPTADSSPAKDAGSE